MSTPLEAAVWMDARCEVTLAELVQLSGLTESELHELIDYGALVPASRSGLHWVFSAACAAISNSTPTPCRWRCACWRASGCWRMRCAPCAQSCRGGASNRRTRSSVLHDRHGDRPDSMAKARPPPGNARLARVSG